MVVVAIVDSGIHAAHPHIGGGVLGGAEVRPDGTIGSDFVDRLGHGTAIAAAIREKAPAAGLLAIRVFDRELRTTATALAGAIDLAVDRGATLINLSLGTTNPVHADRLAGAIARARAAGVAIIAATSADGAEPWLPGSLPGIVPVELDWTCPRHTYRVRRSGFQIRGTCDAVEIKTPVPQVPHRETPPATSRVVFQASGYPREIPGVPKEKNLKGLSFAVANMTGFAARALEGRGRLAPDELVALLVGGVSCEL